MLPLVSSITTVVMGTGLFSNTLIVCGLVLSRIFEVVDDQIGNETLLGVHDRHVDRDRLGGDLDFLTLGRERRDERQRGNRKCNLAHELVYID